MWSDDDERRERSGESDDDHDEDALSEKCTQEVHEEEEEDRLEDQKLSSCEEQHGKAGKRYRTEYEDEVPEWMTSRGKMTRSDYFSTFGTTRDERAGRLIKEQGEKIRNLGWGRWLVPSQSGMTDGYEVSLSGGCATCTCPDFEKRQSACKHIKAAQSLA
jgi:hypothetical protein